MLVEHCLDSLRCLRVDHASGGTQIAALIAASYTELGQEYYRQLSSSVLIQLATGARQYQRMRRR